MFYEIRTYRLKNGTIPQYLKVVEEEGIEIQKSHLGTLVGYFFSEIGTINEIVHIWAFASLDDREARRQRLLADPRWQAFLQDPRPDRGGGKQDYEASKLFSRERGALTA